MGLLDNVKAFVHSITTDDHYASYGSNYNTSANSNPGNIIGSHHGSSSRLNELQHNGSQHSFERSTTPIGYRPGLRSSSNMNSSTDLPMQNFNAQGLPPLPNIDSLWDRIEKWMDEEYPELEDNLNDGVTTADLNEFENDLGVGKLPTEFRQFYKRHDGQMRGGRPTGVVMGLALMDLEGIYEEHTVWSKAAERLEKLAPTGAREGSSKPGNNFMANQRSIPPNSIQPYYFYRGWVPIMKDHIGNQIAIDLTPGSNGQWGQVIIFGRDFDTKLVVASSFQEFIWTFVQDLEAGNYQVDSQQFNEDLGYLDDSRNDDYMIGDEDEDQGELCFYDRDQKEFGGSIKGRLSYIEVLKKRSLKKYGLTENYQTIFTPPKISIKKDVSSPSLIINDDSTNILADVGLPKETLIDNKKKESDIVNNDILTDDLVGKVDKVDISVNDAIKKDSEPKDTEAVKAKDSAVKAKDSEAIASESTKAEPKEVKTEVKESKESKESAKTLESSLDDSKVDSDLKDVAL